MGLLTGITIFNTIHFLILDQVWFFGQYCGPLLAVVTTAINYSTWLTVVMTADKLRLVLDPFNKSHFQIKHGKIACLFLFLFIAIVSSGTAASFKSELTTVQIGGQIVTGYECFSDYSNMNRGVGVIVLLSEILPGVFVPFVLLTVLNCVTFWSVKKQNQSVKHMEAIRASREEKEQRMSRMLLALTVVFVICYVPYMIG